MKSLFLVFFSIYAFFLLNSILMAPLEVVTTPTSTSTSTTPAANLTLEEVFRKMYPSIDDLPENPCTPNMTAADCQKLKNILGNMYTPFTPLIGTR